MAQLCRLNVHRSVLTLATASLILALSASSLAKQKSDTAAQLRRLERGSAIERIEAAEHFRAACQNVASPALSELVKAVAKMRKMATLQGCAIPNSDDCQASLKVLWALRECAPLDDRIPETLFLMGRKGGEFAEHEVAAVLASILLDESSSLKTFQESPLKELIESAQRNPEDWPKAIEIFSMVFERYFEPSSSAQPRELSEGATSRESLAKSFWSRFGEDGDDADQVQRTHVIHNALANVVIQALEDKSTSNKAASSLVTPEHKSGLSSLAVAMFQDDYRRSKLRQTVAAWLRGQKRSTSLEAPTGETSDRGDHSFPPQFRLAVGLLKAETEGLESVAPDREKDGGEQPSKGADLNKDALLPSLLGFCARQPGTLLLEICIRSAKAELGELGSAQTEMVVARFMADQLSENPTLLAELTSQLSSTESDGGTAYDVKAARSGILLGITQSPRCRDWRERIAYLQVLLQGNLHQEFLARISNVQETTATGHESYSSQILRTAAEPLLGKCPTSASPSSEKSRADREAALALLSMIFHESPGLARTDLAVDVILRSLRDPSLHTPTSKITAQFLDEPSGPPFEIQKSTAWLLAGELVPIVYPARFASDQIDNNFQRLLSLAYQRLSSQEEPATPKEWRQWWEREALRPPL